MKRLAILLALTLVLGLSATSAKTESGYIIINPYESVDWTWDQYKANFHMHTAHSDGSTPLEDAVADYYAKGYAILAITEHNAFGKSWQQETSGMIGIDYAIEHSKANHVNSFWADYKNREGQTTAGILESIGDSGGISHINHPGRYTRGFEPIYRSAKEAGDISGINISKKPKTVQKYVQHFMTYPSCVGMEIISRLDWETAADRVLWDEILKETMPLRGVWGFAGDDSHEIEDIGYAFNMMLMPELSQAEVRKAMETGSFYAVTRVSRLDNINRTLEPSGENMPGRGRKQTLYLLEQTTPTIASIEVGADFISILGADYDIVEWIADGNVIATGETLNLSNHAGEINNYVRAQLKSDTGMAFTQPFGVVKVVGGDVGGSAPKPPPGG